MNSKRKNLKSGKHSKNTDESYLRIAVVESDKCKPTKCSLECKKVCPVNASGKICIDVDKKKSFSTISKNLCIGCGMCKQKCPYKAIQIVNLPKSLTKEITHCFGKNAFKLHRLPIPREGQVLGLVGCNGIGKTTALQILAGKLKPNLGNYESNIEWEEVLKYFKGSELQIYFTKLLEEHLTAAVKIQYVDLLGKSLQGQVGDILKAHDQKNIGSELVASLEMEEFLLKNISFLSGGELQRLAIALVCMQNVAIYIFDEPSSYLDVKQRLKAANKIRALAGQGKYVINVEHDLNILDYLSDCVCCLYGKPEVYGIVTMPFGVREGINIYLEGFIPTENMKFRDNELTFKIVDSVNKFLKKDTNVNTYPEFSVKLGTFELDVCSGDLKNSPIVVLLGENGTGKTTFMNALAGYIQEVKDKIPVFQISYKQQDILPKFEGTVREFILSHVGSSWEKSELFKTEIYNQLNIEQLLEKKVHNLAGGELQKVWITVTLAKEADVYLIDEPSAYLDSEQRIIICKIIKRFAWLSKKTIFIAEHDFIIATYLADKIIVYDGIPGKKCAASSPVGLVEGMNKFLENVGITFRRDPTNFRPRVNKINSVKDKEQKIMGNYFCMEEQEKS